MRRLLWKSLPGLSFVSITLVFYPQSVDNRYFDVETRLVPVKSENGFVMDPKDALQYINENTIGVIVILGSTYTGHFENVALMSELCTF